MASKFGTRAQPLMAPQFNVKTEGDNWDKVLKYIQDRDTTGAENTQLFTESLDKIDKDHSEFATQLVTLLDDLRSQEVKVYQKELGNVTSLFLTTLESKGKAQREFAKWVIDQFVKTQKESTESQLKFNNELIKVIFNNTLAVGTATKTFQSQPKNQIHWYALYVLLGFGLSLLVG